MSELPRNWKVSTIGDACETVKGKKPKNSGERSDQRTIPYINIKAFESGLAEQFAEPGEYPTCNEEDVLIVWDGARSGLIGRGVSGYIGSTLARISCDASGKNFLFYFLQSKYGDINSRTKGVGIPHVDPQVLNAIEIPLPPHPEQRRIVAEIEKQFTRLEAGVTGLRRVQANLKRYRAAVLKAACEGRLVPTEAELARSQSRSYEPATILLAMILNERRAAYAASKKGRVFTEHDAEGLCALPEGWTWAGMRQVGEVQLGRQRAPQHHTGDHMRPYLRVANVFEARLDLTDVNSMNFTPEEFQKYRLLHGDILLNEGQTPELVGRPAMFRDEIRDCCYQKTLLRFRAYQGLIPLFALTVFRAYMHNGRFTRAASITTNIAHLTAEKFVEIEFPLPPLAEQARIVAEVERRLSVVEELEAVVSANLQRGSRLRQCILTDALAGKLVNQHQE